MSITRHQFIESLLQMPQIPWTAEAMRDVAMRLGLDAEYYQILFPGGVSELHELYAAILDTKMIAMLEDMVKPDKVRERIALALKVRIITLRDNHYKPSIKSTWATADTIWRYAGDTSTDFNHYTKRGLLAAVYVASKRHYKKDTSVNFKNTEKFIVQSIERVLRVAGLKSKLLKIEDIPVLRLFL